MVNGIYTLRTRLQNVANEIARKKKERGDKTYAAIALEVVRHHAFRRGLTHKIATGTLPTDAWVIIHQQDREDGLGREFTCSEPIPSEEQAMDRLRQHWGDELDQSLIDIMVQRIVYEPKLDSDLFFGSKVITDLKSFKEISTVILTNRLDDNLKDVVEKVYSRDLFGEN